MNTHPDVDAYISALEPWQQKKLTHVRRLILSSSPEIVECVKFKSPFYTYKGFLFYTGVYQKKNLVLGFCNGFLMSDESGVLKADAGQTQIRHWVLEKDAEVNEDLLRNYIQEALLVNDLIYSQQVKRKK